MVATVLAAFILSATPADATAAEQERFKALVLEGERHFGEGDYGAAIWSFRQADALRVTPEIAYNLAKAHEKIGDEPMTAYYFRLYLRRAPDAPDALEVAEILGELLAKMEADGQGLVEIDSPRDGTLTLNGRVWPHLPVAAYLPPGDYDITVRFGQDEVKRTVSVRTGRTSSLTIEPVAPPLLVAEGSSDALSSGGSGGARNVLHVSSMAVMGVSAVALLAGTAFGAMSASEAGRLQTDKSALTVTDAQRLASSAEQKGGTANLLWIAGGAGLAAGGALFVFTLPEPGGAK